MKGVFYNGETSSIFNRTTSGGTNHFGTCHDIDGLPPLVIDKERYRSARKARIDRGSNSSDNRILNNSRIIPSSTATAAIWHSRLGHISNQALIHLATASEGMLITGNCDYSACDACQQGKFKRKHSRVPVLRPEHVYDEISIDVVQSKHAGIGGINWLTIATDGKSLYRHAITHRHKAFAGPELVKLLIHIENQTGRRVKRVRLDNGNEFAEVKAYCNLHGIALLPSTAHNSAQNGRAEVSNYIVEKTARTIMIAGKVPQHLWPEAVNTATMLLNLTPSPALNYSSPVQILAELGTSVANT